MALFPQINWKAHEEDLPPSDVSPKSLRVVITGCVRDCEGHLTEFAFRKLSQLQTLFGECAFLFVQNDSKDNTPHILNAWKDEFERFHVFHYHNMDSYLPLRTARLAYCRNILVKKVFEHYPHYDYMLMMDMDDVFSGRDVSSFLSPFRYNLDSWDVMATAFSSKEYYDTWCLRVQGELEFDICEYIHKHNMYNESWRVAREFQKPIPLTLTKPLRVLSAYAGAAYYKIKMIEGCTFVGTSRTPHGDACDLVSFHSHIRKKGGKIYIDPQFRIQT